MHRATNAALASTAPHHSLTFDETPAAIATSLVLLAADSSGNGLWDALNEDHQRAQQILSELMSLYLSTLDRVAAEVFSLVDADAAVHELFFSEVVTQTVLQLRGLPGAGETSFRSFVELLEQRRSEYGRCREVARKDGEPLDGTVLFSFYKHLLKFGREEAILVMSELALGEVESEVESALADVAHRFMAEPPAAAAN